MTADLEAKLKKLASRKCWSDGDNFVVDDMAGGNVDDAYDGGWRDGETMLARELLEIFGNT